jgi:hypothetical protein
MFNDLLLVTIDNVSGFVDADGDGDDDDLE